MDKQEIATPIDFIPAENEPNTFMCCGVKVHLQFTEGAKLEDRLKNYFQSLKNA